MTYSRKDHSIFVNIPDPEHGFATFWLATPDDIIYFSLML